MIFIGKVKKKRKIYKELIFVSSGGTGSVFSTMKSILILMVFVVLISSTAFAYSYPIIISEQGVNHTQAKELVYSIPEEYYRYVDVVEFVNNDYSAGYYTMKWNNKHLCYNGKITINYMDRNIYLEYLGYDYNKEILEHELGHIYEHCILKEDFSTEEFADGFKI